jgi:UDP-N-acetylglucosamine--N-acetylmuramyl-(pentapeptide) pyrophosphoryl-undecaprenol N-acetylglucosamine transferase
MTTVLVMAGGTGGHVFPALAVARVLESRGCRVIWLGTQRGIEARLVPAAGIGIEWIHVAGLRGKGAVSWLLAPLRLLRALMESFSAIRRIKPDVVLGMGGFVAGPGGVAARILGCPLVIHEQNAIAGYTNRVLASFAQVVAEAFPGAFAASVGARHIGNPVRAEIAAAALPRDKVNQPPHLLVFGGSQGAAALNRVVPEALARIPAAQRPIVIHQTGRNRVESTRDAYLASRVDADVAEFIDDMATAYRWADLVIARSGALTVAELAAVGVPAVLVPYPSAVDDHQTANARYLTDRGAAILMPENQLNPDALAAALLKLMDENGRALVAMSKSALSAAQFGSDSVLADLCIEQAKRRAA